MKLEATSRSSGISTVPTSTTGSGERGRWCSRRSGTRTVPCPCSRRTHFGRPVLGAEIGGITEFVRPGETGFTFASGSADAALADEMTKLAQLDDADVAGLGSTGRRWVEESFSSSRYVERLSELYAGLGVQLGEQHMELAR